MNHASLIIGLAGLTTLTACGDGTPFQDDDLIPVGTAVFADGVYTITQGDTVITLDEDDANTISGQLVWLGELGVDDRARALQGDNVLAVAGIAADETPFAGLTGDIGTLPTGDATYEGEYALLIGDDLRTDDLTLNFDVATGALTNDGGDLTVDATANEITIGGTVEFAGQSAILEGNFFGDDELAAGFTGATMGGVILATQEEE